MTFFPQSLIAILLASHVAFSAAEAPPAIDLTDAVKQIRQTLPHQLSPDVLLTDVNYDKNKQTLIYTATTIDTKASQIDEAKIINPICYNPTLRNAIDQGMTVSFFYYAENKELLKHVVITEAFCESNFKDFEKLLTNDIGELNSSVLPEALGEQLSLFKVAYQATGRMFTANIKTTSDKVNLSKLEKDYSVGLACTHPYFSVLTEKNINFTFNYFNKEDQSPVKSFTVEPKDCLPPNKEDGLYKDELDKQLAHEAAVMKQNLQALSTEQIELVDVGYNPKQRMIWNKAVIKQANITPDKINPRLNVASLCNSPTTRQTIAKGVAYQYSYYDTQNNLLTSFVVDNDICKAFDQTNNILLQR